MPKILFYAGTAFCLFLALTSAAEAVRGLGAGNIAFGALAPGGEMLPRAPWAILVALLAGLGSAAIFLRMAALLAARNLFGAFLAVFSVTGAVVSLAALMLLQSRIYILGRTANPIGSLLELHFAGCLVLGYFLSVSLLALRPYFRVQASRFLSVLVSFPLPVFGVILVQELFATGSPAPLPPASPASFAFFAIVAVLFFSIAVHCIRHRHLFIEVTNLRELLEGRSDPSARPSGRPLRLGGAAFDS